jgi:UDP-N-acetyl-D-mannosaminuronate dehydrogenase
MENDMLRYVKFIGPCAKDAGELAKKHFEKIGIKTEILKSPVETELAKLFSTTYYGLCIAFHQDMERICEKFGADFEQAVTRFNETYNEGIKENLKRPVMFPGFIGGHCVIPNIHILKKDVESDFLDAILRSNELKKSKTENRGQN